MIIEYMGHSCFRVKDFQDTGYKVVFDPYKIGSVPGYRELGEEGRANVVLCSHEHDDHYGMDNVSLEPFEGECPFEIEKLDSFHDDEHGALRGSNTVHVVTLKSTGEKVVHYGDFGMDIDEFLTEENLAKVSGADYALVPVGGVYTLDAEQAVELIEKTQPKVAVAMHYRNDTCKCGFDNLGSERNFLMKGMENCHETQYLKFSFIDTHEEEIDYEMISLMPECCTIHDKLAGGR